MARTSQSSLDSIAIFVRVAQSTSFTSAARELGLSASGVSRAIARLEERLGTKLIDRTTRRLKLTNEGNVYLESCRQILFDIEEAEARLLHTATIPQGTLRIQVPRGFGRKVISPALSGFLSVYPEVKVDVTVRDGSIDPSEDGVDASFVLGTPAARGFVARRITTIGYAICAAPGYLTRHGAPETLADLKNHLCLNYLQPRSGRAREWVLSDGKKSTIVEIESILTANDIQLVHQAAISGAGLAYLMDFLIADDVKAGRLKIVLQKYILREVPVHICYPRSQFPSPRLNAFLSYLAEIFDQKPAWSIDRLISN